MVNTLAFGPSGPEYGPQPWASCLLTLPCFLMQSSQLGYEETGVQREYSDLTDLTA